MQRRWAGFGFALLLSYGVCLAPSAAVASRSGDPQMMRRHAGSRSANRVLSDVTITGKVKSALIDNERVAARRINVDTVRGIVHLRGRVRSRAEARSAVIVARRVEGVRGVRNHLQVAARRRRAM